MRTLLPIIACIVFGWSFAAYAAEQPDLDRLQHGEIIYESLQDKHMDALIRLKSGRPLKQGWPRTSVRTLSELRLNLGLSELVENNNNHTGSHNQALQNYSAYQLAWFYYHDGRPMEALNALNTIKGPVDRVSSDDVLYLRALANIGVGKFSAANGILDNLTSTTSQRVYIRYNLAMAQLLSGNKQKGRWLLDEVGQTLFDDDDVLALKDLANLKLGYHYLEAGKLEEAKIRFSRIRLDGPFTEQALLGLGWTSFFLGDVKRAVVVWSVLHEKPGVNSTVIEAKMALPYAYSKLNAHGKAANLYAHAIELFDAELARLKTSSDAVRGGQLRQSILDARGSDNEGWVITLSNQAGLQDPYYLPLLLANDDFRSLADSLNELARIRNRIDNGLNNIDALIELARLKQKHNDTALPAVKKPLLEINTALKSIEQQTQPPPGAQNRKPARIDEIVQLQAAYTNTFKLHAATSKYNKQIPAYSRQLNELAKKLKRLDKKIDREIARTAQQIESIALEMLEQQRKRLENYRSNALFAMAESYDFATGKQQ
ncbi:MAG: hypothetical protein JSW45_03805 [Thiotrichales bacterium]|nr:MAG: hypothetical protein JSW45_03805 [Thiotrichales bacterium]